MNMPSASILSCLAFLTPAAVAQSAESPPLRADALRVEQRILQLGTFGANPDGGVSRVAFSDADRAGREYVAGLMREAGLTVRVDAAGNIYFTDPSFGLKKLPQGMEEKAAKVAAGDVATSGDHVKTGLFGKAMETGQGVVNILVREAPGIVLVVIYMALLPPLLAKTVMRTFYIKMGFVRFFMLVTLIQFMAALPIKMVLRWTLNLKYIVYIPEFFFNI